jgi:peroxiredoxin
LPVGCGPTTGIAIGNQAPDFTLLTMEGTSITLSDLRGNPVIVNFWASWCGPCRIEIPHLKATYEKYSGQGLEILAIDLAFNDSIKEVNKVIESEEMRFPVLLDLRGEVAGQYAARVIPTSFLIDSDGIIRNIKIGAFRTQSEIDKMLESLQS